MSQCASPDVLAELLREGISEEEASSLREHLMGCTACQAQMDRLSDRPELRSWASVGGALASWAVEEPGLTELLAKLRVNSTRDASSSQRTVEPDRVTLEFLAPPRHDGDLGTLGPYRVLAELGRGGMGIVLLAHDPELERTVAIKVLPPHRADERARARFVREARAAARLNHDHIVPVYSVANPADGPPYLVMQFVDGPTLRQRIKGDERLAPREAARICLQVAEGLAAAHGAGLVHRDIKPANIILDEANGRAKIMDFGLVRTTSLPAGTTLEGTVLGTPEYMSPEQARAADQSDARSDVYSLGVTLYQALTGELPFRGVAHLVLQQVQNDEPRPPRRLNDQVPRDLETICLKAMAKEPGLRYQTAQEMADDLRRWLGGEPIRARPVGTAVRFWRWCRRKPALASLAAALALAVIGGLAATTSLWLLARHRGVEAQQKAEQAEQQSVEAQQEREKAEMHFRKAKAAVDEMLARVGAKHLAGLPGVDEIRRELLQKALLYYQGFLEQSRNDQALWRETGHAYNSLATIYQCLGQYKEAKEAYESALAVFQELIKDSRGQPDLRHDLARTFNDLAEFLRTTGRLEEAAQAFHRSVEINQQLVDDFPDQPGLQNELARSHTNLGIALVDLGRSADAEAAYRHALEILSRLPVTFLSQPEYQWELAHAHMSLGNLLQTTRRPGEAEEAYRQAVEILQGLTTKFPHQLHYRLDLARTLNNLGILHATTGARESAREAFQKAVGAYTRLAEGFPTRPDIANHLATTLTNLAQVRSELGQLSEAEQDCRRALEVGSKLVADFPTRPDYHQGLAASLGTLANVLTTKGELSEARPFGDRAVEQYEAALKLNPKNQIYRRQLRDCKANLADLLVRLRQHEEASRIASELPGLSGQDPEDSLEVTSLLARCVPLALDDSNFSEARRRQLAETYAARAIDSLRQAILQGYKDIDHLKKDSKLEPLRSRNDFQELLLSVK